MSKISNFWKLVNGYLKESYFPSFCVNCHRDQDLVNDFLCAGCNNKIELIKSPTCPACGKLNSAGQYCPNCRSKTALTGMIVAAKFEGPVKELVHYLKYVKMQRIASMLGEMIIKRLSISDIRGDLVLVPVPLHICRRLKRGFNQSELIAKYISKKKQIPYTSVLKRVKNTPQQMKLNRKLRLKNLEGAFKCIKNSEIIGRTVLLVDDVSTTGATLNECAKVLRTAGAKQIFGLVVARG